MMDPFIKIHKDKIDTRGKIFISYREKDTAGETGRLVDALKDHFSDDQIFIDIDKIEPGVDFTEAITHSLQSCNVFLAIIGPNWLGVEESGKRFRIFDTNDWVRLEVATALQRKIRVIPVLVDNGIFPQPDQIPPDLHPLLKRQAYEISNKRWKYDTDQLISILVKSIGIQPKNQAATPVRAPGQKPWLVRNAIWLLLIVLLTSIVVYLFNTNGPTDLYPGNNSVQKMNVPDTILSTEKSTVNNPSGNDPSLTNPGSLDGAWIEQDEGARSTFHIKQNKDRLSVEVHALGQKIGDGTGSINGQDISIEFSMFGNKVDLKARLSSDKKTMKGTYTFAITGDAQPVELKRIEN